MMDRGPALDPVRGGRGTGVHRQHNNIDVKPILPPVRHSAFSAAAIET